MSEANLVYTECRSCKARIFWAKTVSGVTMPLDAKPDPKGTHALVDGTIVVAHNDLFGRHLPDSPRYRSHLNTCPEAAHNKEKKDD